MCCLRPRRLLSSESQKAPADRSQGCANEVTGRNAADDLSRGIAPTRWPRMKQLGPTDNHGARTKDENLTEEVLQ